jgi:hypothetical protein
MFRSEDVVLVTRDGRPAGFYVPWDATELPLEVKRDLFARLAQEVAADLDSADMSEDEVLRDFAARRRRR